MLFLLLFFSENIPRIIVIIPIILVKISQDFLIDSTLLSCLHLLEAEAGHN